MSFENLYGIEVYRLALRETLNEGGDEHESSTESVESRGDAGAEQNASERAAMGQVGDTKKDASTAGGEEAREIGNVVKLDPIASRRGSKDTPGSSQRVLLVTRPSQRDMQIWTQRATSKMVRSAGGTMRPQVTSAQSKRWVLEYKPVVRHSGWLIKRGNGRLRSFKRRLFCIIDNELVYHDSHSAVEVRGRVDLSKKSTVQPLLHSGFKLTQGSLQMALYAVDKHERDVWIKKLQEHNVELLPASSKTVKQLKKQSSLPDESRILFSGWLRKRGQMVKSTKRRWFELSMTTLTYYTHPQGTKKGSLEITDATISHMDTLKSGERHSFQVKTSSRRLILHADSQEDRSLWVASLSSAAEGSSSVMDSFSIASMASEVDRCTCGGANESGVGDGNTGQCLRCKSSFIAPSEDALMDVTREVQLILASPYSPEGSTSGAFIKEHTGKPVLNVVVREFMSGLADYMIHTRMNELRSLGGHSDASNSDDDDEITELPFTEDSVEFIERILVVIYEQIEERVLFPLYKGIHDNITQQTRADSKLIQGKIDILRSKSQSFFGIGPDSISPSDWSSACAKLKEVDKVSLPYMKRAQLLGACKEIYAVYHQEHPKNAPMSADDFIPAFIYVLIQSNLDNPVALKELVTVFSAGSTQGEIAYFVTCLEIALEYIRSLLTACTVKLDATKQLGIEFAKDEERDVAVVHRLIPDSQAEKSKAVTVGDVVVAVNGLPVYEMALDEIVKIIRGVDGDAELCFLPMDEYEMKFGMSRKSADDPRDTVSTQSSAALA